MSLKFRPNVIYRKLITLKGKKGFQKGESKPKGAGRKAGTPNKKPGISRKWRDARAYCEEKDFDPFEILVALATNDIKFLKVDKDVDLGLREKAADACCKYVHPQLKATEFRGKDGEDLGKAFADAVANI